MHPPVVAAHPPEAKILYKSLVVDSGEPKEAQIQSCSPGGANVPDNTAVSCAKMAELIEFSLHRPSAAAMRPYVKLR